MANDGILGIYGDPDWLLAGADLDDWTWFEQTQPASATSTAAYLLPQRMPVAVYFDMSRH